MRRASPEARLHLLDLAIIDRASRRRALKDAIEGFRPDAIAFSWRDVQVFSPHDMDGAMRDAFTFFYDPSPFARARAAVAGLCHILSYRAALSDNLSLIRAACAIAPSALIAVGGPSVTIFGDLLRPRMPDRVHLVPSLVGLFPLLGLPVPEDPFEPMLDLAALVRSFPQFPAYANEEIGVQTKRGCPLSCLYCLYGFLEGRRIVRRQPERIVREIENYHKRWGSRRLWFVDAQLLSDPPDDAHLQEILERMAARRLDLGWSGYIRVNRLTSALAGMMVKTGLRDIEIALNSGAQPVLDELRMGFSAGDVVEGLRVLDSAGYRGGVKIDLSLNSPGETRQTLKETIRVIERIRAIFGADRVRPVVFFLAIQPHTGLEKKALADGSLRKGYDPISVWPWSIRNLIYNPPPLGGIVGRSCSRAFRAPEEERGDMILSNLEAALSA
ncbi:MAG: radical SAM protein [Syntrophorhabdales bacterium]